jgi:RND family efflux transporter MFP subunit
VVVEPAVAQNLATGKAFVGTLMPRRRSIVGSAVDGRVVEFIAKEGTWVRKGDPLTKLLTKTIEIEIKAAEAELMLREKELEEMLKGSLDEEKAQSEAKVKQCKALMDFAKQKQLRWQRLFDQGNSASREEMELANQEAIAAEQAYLSAVAVHQLVMEGPRIERKAQAAARRDVAAEQVNLLRDRLEKYTMKAPFDGYVVAEHTEVGAWITQGDIVAEVIEIDPIEVTVNVPELYIAGLQETVAAYLERNEPTPADVRVDALGTTPFAGQVARIVPQADTRSRTFPVKVQLSNPLQGAGHLLKAGMIAHVTVPIGKARPTTLVPKDALVLGGRSPMVCVVDSDPKTKQNVVRIVPVEIGISQGSLVQVLGDVKPGEKVVVRGNERLRPGQSVNILSAPTTPTATAAVPNTSP